MATIRHKKSLGQHFLEDQTVLEGIVECAGVGPEDTVLEIGPGSGNMTRLLAARAKRLVAVEKPKVINQSQPQNRHLNLQ